MRTNKKDSLLATALSIVESDGLAALTYDSLSAASGISKSGLIYHFPTRHQLLVELNTSAARTWTRELEAAAGGARIRGFPQAENACATGGGITQRYPRRSLIKHRCQFE